MVFLIVWAISLFSGQGHPEVNPTMATLCVPADFQSFLSHPWTLVTYMATQYAPLHLLFNMLWLLWFGKMLREEAGSRPLLAAYLGGGIAGGLSFLGACGIWPSLASPGDCLCGASASVLSVMAAVSLLAPDRRIKSFPIRGVELKWVVLVCLLLTFIGTGGAGNAAGCAAHTGGAAFGAAMATALRRRSSRAPSRAISGGSAEIPDTQRLGLLLDKIRTSGYASLSSGERTELSKTQQLHLQPSMSSFPIVGPILRLALRVLSLIIWGLTILAAYGGRFDTDYFSVPAIFCLILPYLAILSGVFIIYWLLTRKIVFAAIGALAIVACVDPLSQVFPINSAKTPTPGAQTFRIMSWNILHLDDLAKPEYEGNRAVEFLINSEADVICLAELDNFTSELKKVPGELVDSLFSVYPYRAGQKGTDLKVLSKYPVEAIDNSGLAPFRSRRFDFFRISMPRHSLTVAVAHLYSYDLSEEERQVVSEIKSVETAKTSVREFKGPILGKMRNAFPRRAENARLLREVIDHTPGPLIVCGDFNDVPESWAYNIIRGDDMRDAYTETNFGPTYTYNKHLFLFHIDQMLYRGPLRALSLKVLKFNSSDHYPLSAKFEFTGK